MLMCLLNWVVIIVCIFYSDRRVRRSSQICLLCWSVYVLFFCWRANLNTDKPLFKEVVGDQFSCLFCVFTQALNHPIK